MMPIKYTVSDVQNYVTHCHGKIIDFHYSQNITKKIRKVTIQCEHGHIWECVISSLMFNQTWCHKCRIKHRTLIRQIQPEPKIYLPDATSSNACKIIQCDPSVHVFETILINHPEFMDYKEPIIKTIRDVNKYLFKCHEHAHPKIIVAAAIYLFCLRHGIKTSQKQCGKLVGRSDVTVRSFLKKLLTQTELRVIQNKHNIRTAHRKITE
jgi:hypothetical protein